MSATQFERQVLTTLARVEEGLRQLRVDHEDEKGYAHHSRETVRAAIGDIKGDVQQIRQDISAAAGLAAENRKLIDTRIMPAVRTLDRLGSQGALILSAAAIAGALLTAVLSANWLAFWEWLKRMF